MSEDRNEYSPFASIMTLRELRGTFTKKARMYIIESRSSEDPKVVCNAQGAANAYADAAALVMGLYEPHRSYDDCWEKCRGDIAAGVEFHERGFF